MILVVDANVLFSFFVSESKVRELVLDPKLELNLDLRAPKLLFIELDRHRGEICRKAGISEEGYEFPRNALDVFINAAPEESWQDCRAEASKLLPDHPKDVPYIALALKLGCPVWSNEGRLKKQSKVRVYSTSDLIRKFGL